MKSRQVTLRKLSGVGAIFLLTAGLMWFSGGWFKVRAALAVVRNEPSQLVCESLRYDFGRVTRGQQLEAHFSLSNLGGRRLILYREDGDCACSTSDTQLLLAPGASAQLTATLDTNTLNGPIQTTIRYRSNDPRAPMVELTMLAEVASKP